MINVRAIGFCFAMMLLCSCATQNSVHPKLPADTAFIKDSERIYLTLRLENGKELLFVMDTGATFTVLDKSLEPILGKCLGTRKANYPFFGKATLNAYQAPKLYLGNTPLLTGKRVYTDDLSKLEEDKNIMGILGMDCLRHYCLQLNFFDHQIHFLNPDYSKNQNLCEKFPLKYNLFDGIPFICANFFGKSNARWEIDTGCDADIALKPEQLRELQKQTSDQFIFSKHKKNSTNGLKQEIFSFAPKIIFNGEICTNFIWSDARGKNLIGLRFLSRHLTTLNFPKRIMYLQPGNAESLAANDSLTNFLGNSLDDIFYSFVPEATNFLIHLAEKEQLPGFTKSERGNANISWHPNNDNFAGYPISETFVLTKTDDAFQYHYTIVQLSKNSPLKLRRAWRTDSNERIIEEYLVP